MNGEFVVDIEVGKKDFTGVEIEHVYSKVGNIYAVYRTRERVVVQYSDDDGLGADQRLLLTPLNPTRGEINGLIDGWRSNGNGDEKAIAKLFDRRVADALTVALQGQSAHALELLTALKADIMEERTAAARRDYIYYASIAMVLVVAATLVLYKVLETEYGATSTTSELSLASLLTWPAAIGSVGAFFSIAMGIRGRTIGTDLQTSDNMSDAILRIVIGSFSAVVLVCLLSGQWITFSFGGSKLGSELPLIKPAVLLVVAFAAGFSERLVGDLLSRSAVTPVVAGNPLAGGKVVPPVANSGVEANERNPLGRQHAPASAELGGHGEPGVADEELDGCCSGSTLTDDDVTDDIDLPPASGGVEQKAA
jgi:hypothetical protein